MTAATSSGVPSRPGRDRPLPGGDLLGAVALQALGEDRPRRDADRADPVAAPLAGEARGEVLDRGPRRRRVGEAGDAAARAEADEDDDAAAVGDHRARRDRPRHVPGRVDREPVHGAPALEGDLLGRRDELAAGVVDEDVDAAEALERGVDQRLDLLGLAHVGRHGEALGAERLHGRPRLLQRLRAAAADHHRRAVAGQRERGRAPDPGAAAGDERDHGLFTAPSGSRPSSTARTESTGRVWQASSASALYQATCGVTIRRGQAGAGSLRRRRLHRDDVEGGAAEPAALELAPQRLQVDELRPGRVDEDGAVGHERELLRAEQAVGLGRQRDVERDGVAGGEQLVERRGRAPAAAISSADERRIRSPDLEAERAPPAPPAPARCARARRRRAASRGSAAARRPPASPSRRRAPRGRARRRRAGARGRARARGRRPPRRSSRGRCRPRSRAARASSTSTWSKPTLQVATTRRAGRRSRSAARTSVSVPTSRPTTSSPPHGSRASATATPAPSRSSRTRCRVVAVVADDDASFSPEATAGVTITARGPRATVHEKEIEIRWRDCDPYGHVNHAVFLTYLEEVRDEWLIAAVGEDALGYVVARVEIDYRRELTQQDDRDHGAHPAGLARDVERAHRRGARPRGRDESPPRRRPSSSPATSSTGRGRSPARSATCSSVLEALLSPLRLGPVELPNRIVSTAHQTTLVHDHLPTEDFVAYHEARARGGTGLIVLEATAVDPSGLLTPHTLAGYREESRPGSRASPRPCARTAPGSSSSSSTAGASRSRARRARRRSRPRRSRAAASTSSRARRRPRTSRRSSPATPARPPTSPRPGLDGVEISAAHDYLAAQFFTPELNRREDEWAEPGALPPRGARRGARRRARARARRAAERATRRRRAPVVGELAGRVDYVSVALGESSTYLGSVGIVPPPPTPENAIAEHAAGFRLGPPLVATTRIVDPGRGRPPDRRRGRRRGRDDAGADHRSRPAPQGGGGAARGRPPLHRLQRLHRPLPRGTAIACTQNPRTGRERTLAAGPRGRRAGAVVVVGGGPGGAGRGGGGERRRARGRRSWSGPAGSAASSRSPAPRPMHEEVARSLTRNYERLLGGRRRAARHGGGRGVGRRARARPGRRRHGRPAVRPRVGLDGIETVQAWDVLAGPVPAGPAGSSWRTGAATPPGSPPPSCWPRRARR